MKRTPKTPFVAFNIGNSWTNQPPAHNQHDLVSVDLDGERINILEAVERADSLLGDHP